jgi:hypothetical protein
MKVINMKKCVVLLLLLSSCAVGSNININENFPHNEIQKIAVIMFEAPIEDVKKGNMLSEKALLDANAGSILSSLTARALEKWERYVVVNRRAVEEELKLKKLKKEDLLHTQNYLKLGKQLGVDAIVVGKIEHFGVSYRAMSSGLFFSPLKTRVLFTVRCVDVITNETIWTVKIKGNSVMDNERALASKLITEAFEALKTKLN